MRKKQQDKNKIRKDKTTIRKMTTKKKVKIRQKVYTTYIIKHNAQGKSI